MAYLLKAEKVGSVRAPREKGICRDSRLRSHNNTTIFDQVTLDIEDLYGISIALPVRSFDRSPFSRLISAGVKTILRRNASSKPIIDR